jgi:hypothetical protein
MMDRRRYQPFLNESGRLSLEGDIVEIPLLMPSWQVDVLENAAHDRGLTAAEMVRQLLRSFIMDMQNQVAGTRGAAGKAETAPAQPAL